MLYGQAYLGRESDCLDEFLPFRAMSPTGGGIKTGYSGMSEFVRERFRLPRSKGKEAWSEFDGPPILTIAGYRGP
jgi:hypothetical protein